MKIILDSNIIIQDFLLKSRKIEMFLDFLSKNTYEIYLPSVVVEEVSAEYERKLNFQLNAIDKSYTELNRLLTSRFHNNRKKMDAKIRTRNYIQFLLNKLHVLDEKIIETEDISVDELVKRAVSRKKPFTERREAFRDSVIWLCVLQEAKSSREKKVIFISNNTKDFGEKSGELNIDLSKEAETFNTVVDYYLSIDDFLKNHAKSVPFITANWLKASIDFTEVRDGVLDYLDANRTETYTMLAEMGYNVRGIESFHCYDTIIRDYYVYEMTDGSLRLEVLFEIEIGIDFLTVNEGGNSISLEGESQFHYLLEGNSIVSTELQGAWLY